jgi:hypothetical protein
MTIAENIVTDIASQGGTLLAFQVGCRYPRFTGAAREPLAETFERHGFPKIARRLRAITPARALAHVCSRPGDVARAGLHLVEVKLTDSDHQQAWVICRASEVGVEDVEHTAGARVFSSPAGCFSAGPIAGSADPACRALADDLAARAALLHSTCDIATVSKSITDALASVAAYPFLSRGAYILRANDPGTQRLVGLYRDLRAQFYDESRRAGLQAGVAEIMGHAGSGNMLAVSDAVINDAEEQVAALVATLADDQRRSGKLRTGTLAKHRDAAQGILDAMRPVRELLGASFERIERLTRGVLAAYQAASTPADLEMPDWITDETADLATADEPSVATTPTADEPTADAADPEDDPFRDL